MSQARIISIKTQRAPRVQSGFESESEMKCLLYDSHQKGKMMIMIMKTPGSQVESSVAEGNGKEGGGRKMRDVHKDT